MWVERVLGYILHSSFRLAVTSSWVTWYTKMWTEFAHWVTLISGSHWASFRWHVFTHMWVWILDFKSWPLFTIAMQFLFLDTAWIDSSVFLSFTFLSCHLTSIWHRLSFLLWSVVELLFVSFRPTFWIFIWSELRFRWKAYVFEVLKCHEHYCHIVQCLSQ